MAVLNSENSEDVDIDEEISKLLSAEAVKKDPEPDTFDSIGNPEETAYVIGLIRVTNYLPFQY